MYYFIVNPKASSGVGLKKWKALAVLLKKISFPIRSFLQTERAAPPSMPVSSHPGKKK